MNPRLLQLARESRGLSQSKLAGLAGISQAALSKAENGVGTLTPERMQAVADTLGYPTDLLSWPDEPVGLGPSGFYHRKQSGLGKTALQRIEAEVNLLLMQLRRLEASVDIEPIYRLPVLDADEHSPEEAAAKLRASWLIPDGPVHDVIRTVERAGIVVVRRDLESPKISGLSVRPPNSLPVIILNIGMPPARERFTVLHELGHLVMHQLPSNDGEREADVFASEFLMPGRLVGPHLSGLNIQKMVQLKQHWKASMAAVLQAAKRLERIDESRYKSLQVQLSQHGYRRNEPAEPEREEPGILDSILETHRSDHGYSDRELAKVVGLQVREFRSEYGSALALHAV
ncbi:helix-turn-helix domain-containing protein [Kitasatospora sp. NPDC056184]|uniref:helix-turn-helix domain-containing protein n=1 Tax=Kitasatospora sp. NPDC056184 TaxID=3345738 RepID=UPI0035D894D2